LFEVEYLAIGEVDVTDIRWLDVGRSEVTYFVIWLPDCDKWGIGGLLCPHPDISDTGNRIFFYFGMAMQLDMGYLLM
jgi:hypothetical protein